MTKIPKIIFIAVLFVLTAQADEYNSKFVIVTDNQGCYSFRMDAYVADECYETVGAAQDHIDIMKEYEAHKREFKTKTWVDVE